MPDVLGLPALAVFACVTIVYIGSTVQASIGVGLGMLSSPILALVDSDFIPATIVLSVVPLTGSIAWAERRHIDRRGLGFTLAGRLPGVIAGAAVAARLTDTAIGVMVSVTVLFAVVVSVTARQFRGGDATHMVAGLASGFMGTATGVGGPPMALAYQHSDPPTMRGTLSAFFFLGALMSITTLSLYGQIGSRQLELAALLIPSVLAGVFTARRVRHRISAAIVRPGVLVVCTVSALTLLIRTVT